MKNYLLSSSIISANLACLGEETVNVISAGVDMIHFDVMDGRYVSNLTIGPMVLSALRDYGISAPFDVHLMVKPVSDYLIKEFAAAGANSISFHLDAMDNIEHSINFIKNHGCKVGLVFNPGIVLNNLENILSQIDVIIIMSVNPGSSGQSFLYSTLTTIRQVHNIINQNNYNICLEVDGGITTDNISMIADAGADIFVIGTTIFNTTNYKKVVDSLRYKLTSII